MFSDEYEFGMWKAEKSGVFINNWLKDIAELINKFLQDLRNIKEKNKIDDLDKLIEIWETRLNIITKYLNQLDFNMLLKLK